MHRSSANCNLDKTPVNGRRLLHSCFLDRGVHEQKENSSRGIRLTSFTTAEQAAYVSALYGIRIEARRPYEFAPVLVQHCPVR
jgi:hypothetical protein